MIKNSVWCVIRNNKGKFLLLKRSKNTNNGGQWNFPGGKMEKNESIIQAGTREFHEECGVNFSNWKYFLTLNDSDKRMNYIRPQVVIDPKIYINSESQTFGWFSLKEARDKHLHFPTAEFFKHITNKDNLEYRKRLVQGQLFLDVTCSVGTDIASCSKLCIPSRKLHNMRVDPFYRGLGLANFMMKTVMAMPNHPTQLTAYPDRDSSMNVSQLVNFYGKFGFVPATVTGSISGPVLMKYKT
ncbi:MAG: NUDIX domain-containing protein [Rhodospirillales bacterium]|nr:NUDIX domain-containing protein [Rhodospirillales bacterium]